MASGLGFTNLQDWRISLMWKKKTQHNNKLPGHQTVYLHFWTTCLYLIRTVIDLASLTSTAHSLIYLKNEKSITYLTSVSVWAQRVMDVGSAQALLFFHKLFNGPTESKGNSCKCLMLHGTVNLNKLQGERKLSPVLLWRNWIELNAAPFFLLVSLYVLQRLNLIRSFILKKWSTKAKQEKKQ